ncbi:PhzF family phenazine biosynthesis protein [Roseospira marina]|uniref:PhzF family phenazine biosynthesis protein n=1 Tax=Roseospira marina TaxID=140057 RepID=A0A5M6I6F3_9PROT|nr:PhzF family phenazine biosynthesis isomerase [Roseospira marina]KAA5603804.1 PhzF family phenazine biosynthesis protein [Roseospira marina]MBB4316013.1 trans-2,3-dihydro-3-hydroxyanthranilate isomerase [Roseospira marina]MBB5089179.1 trans-2,3-dihydro-3-hydroxyanthranilate isomerase [Roseospira marina]
MRQYIVVDAFAEERLCGNPVAVFLGSDDLSDEDMQAIAREMNLSETTFVLQPKSEADWHVRIFTPVNELPFAGHPLLGTAIALARYTDKPWIRIETAMGVIPFEVTRRDGRAIVASMDQPVPTWEPFHRSDELLAALGVQHATLPIEVYRNGPRHVFVGLEAVSQLSSLAPDHRALSRFEDLAINCFAPADDQWRVRMFSPAYGVVEDAATGSAAGPLAIHLARHGLRSFGDTIDIIQGVEIKRRSRMHACAEGHQHQVSRVKVWGAGVLFADCVAFV